MSVCLFVCSCFMKNCLWTLRVKFRFICGLLSTITSALLLVPRVPARVAVVKCRQLGASSGQWISSPSTASFGEAALLAPFCFCQGCLSLVS